jgi:hypothetical protein
MVAGPEGDDWSGGRRTNMARVAFVLDELFEDSEV